jgi:tryptophan synthase beta chain
LSEVAKIFLDESEMPKQWYNVQADMKNIPPPLDPITGGPPNPEKLIRIFNGPALEQEMSRERWITIPEEVLNIYRLWRPSPLHRALRLEQALGTPAKIYFKNESVSPAGSHKPNTAIPQAFLAKKAGLKRISTETGAGQWGSAISLACTLFDLNCTVYMVKVSYQQKPYRRSLMQVWGSEVIPSPSDRTEAGRSILKEDPDSLGSLGIAISEAAEDAMNHDDTCYTLGSVLNHVCLHQTVIGLEAKAQLAKVGAYPDVIFASCGGGSNFAGIGFPFIPDKLDGKKIRIVAVEPTACPTLTQGVFAYDYGDTAKVVPLLAKMYTLGHDFVPPGIHAGGLRYHGDSPLVSQLLADGLVEAEGVKQTDVFKAAILFAKTEGILPAPESAHAIASAIAEANRCKESKEPKTILFNLSGHGHFDLGAYDNYLSGHLEDYEYPKENIMESLKKLPKL